MSDHGAQRALGSLVNPQLTGDARDAVHIAIIAVKAATGVVLHPGDKVTLDPGGLALEAVEGNAGVGVVDPFLPDKVRGGDRFWLLLYPGTIRTLRHEWSSDVFPLPAMVEVSDGAEVSVPLVERTASEEWLREFAKDNFNEHRETVESYYQRLIAGDCPDVHTETTKMELQPGMYLADELWKHIENVTGKRVSTEQRQSAYFSCWC